ncbi:hypothetical protein FRC02_003756 [Tulasnella sp. 418]|nr:hypothetical protein FRC02_003756 [Tulasnella sp. 418]
MVRRLPRRCKSAFLANERPGRVFNIQILHSSLELCKKPRPGLVSLWYANGTIERYMRRRDSPDRLGLMLGCASGIEYLHGEEVIHGDIRPVNILIDDSESPVITDFGSTSYGEDEIAPDDFTPSRFPTEPRYMAVERTKFANLPSYPSDVYSFGCLILFLATSRHPFRFVAREDEIIKLRVRSDEYSTPPPAIRSITPSYLLKVHYGLCYLAAGSIVLKVGRQ